MHQIDCCHKCYASTSKLTYILFGYICDECNHISFPDITYPERASDKYEELKERLENMKHDSNYINNMEKIMKEINIWEKGMNYRQYNQLIQLAKKA